jgi:predicted DNA-binding ArsR family transcriptional regulator
MAPTLGLVDRSEMEGVFVGDTRAESSQASQMSSSNRSNGGTHLDGDTASQSERGSVYESNLQASGEELRHAAVTPHDAITAEALMEPPQPAPAPAPHPGLLSELIRMQEERDRMQEERDAEVARVYNQIRTTAMLQAQMAEQQAQMSEQHKASRAESRAHFQAVLSQFNSVQEAQRKSDEKAQKAQDEVKKMKEEFNVMVEEKLREKLLETVDQKIEGLLREKLPKAIKKEVKREKVKKEKAEGKPKFYWSMYNIHVSEERKRLGETSSKEFLFKVAAQSWWGMSEAEKWRRYGDMFNQGKERYEREMDLWKERKVPADERKPAAKPVAEEQAIAQETVRDVPIETRPTPEEPVVAAAAAGAPVRPGRLQQEPAASSASDEDGNTQEFTARPGVAFQGSTSSVVTNKKRKNSSPYWYKGAPVFELEGYTDGTPLRPGHVWVEYDSGTAVQVKDAELVKKLPPARNSRRRLSHNLFAIRSTTSREANTQEERNSSEALPPSNVPAATSPPESIIVNHRRNQAAFGEPPGHDCRQRSNESPVPFPVGYRFYHTVSKGKHHGGYMCLAEVKAVIGNSEFDSFLIVCRFHSSIAQI